ncbi:MAG: Mth938-like domain-containing protein [Amylibacter sp.]
MQMSAVRYEDQVPVDSYGPGFFRVQEELHEGAMFLNADGVLSWGGFDDLAPLINSIESYDIVFIGTGADIAPLPKDVRTALDDAGVATEVMSSPSACRTYNVLLSEGRSIALAVLAV